MRSKHVSLVHKDCLTPKMEYQYIFNTMTKLLLKTAISVTQNCDDFKAQTA